MNVKVMPSKISGSVTVPPSKSASHRAIIAAALAKGESVIKNVDLSSDILATIGACENLGCDIKMEKTGKYNTLYIKGGLGISQECEIECGESGSTLRFFIPIACALIGKKTFTGRGRLPQRPIDAYYEIFNDRNIAYTKPQGSNLPLTVDGALTSGEYIIDGSVSSQYITGLLFALPLLSGDSEITVINNFESKGYVDLTIGVLQQFGIDIARKDNTFFIKGNQAYKPQSYIVEGDYSQAAFFIVGGAIAGDITIKGLKQNSLQPDSSIIDILKRMDANIEQTDNGLLVKKSRLSGTDIDVSQCPDLVPPLAIAAVYAKGTTKIYGAARLRIKESDRLLALGDNLRSLGINARETEDSLIIDGGGISGGQVTSFNDHRIVMAFSIAALAGKQGIDILGAECIDKSYPGFSQDLRALGGKVI